MRPALRRGRVSAHPQHHLVERARLRAAAAVLLTYPDEALVAALPTLREAAGSLPAALGAPVRDLVDHLAVAPLSQVQEHYVATFDLRRRCCLYLSYYLNGDTRRRGMALVDFKRAYRSAGLECDAGELPDYLPAVLQLAAVESLRGGGTVAEELLVAHRRGIEVLQLGLRQAGSPYEGLVGAVLATLPPASADEHQAALTLAFEGPPAEQVGLEPYAGLETSGART